MKVTTTAVALAIVLALVATPAGAASGQLFVPVAPLASDHFNDAQLAAAMTDAGYPGSEWDLYTSCVQDAQWSPATPLWLVCWTALDQETGTWDHGYVEWTPAMFAPHGVAWRVVTG